MYIDLTNSENPSGEGGTTNVNWGDIKGSLDNQSDLLAALNDKASISLSNLDETGQAVLDSKANDNAVVHREGAETVAGSKTFTNNTYIGETNNPANLDIVGNLNIAGNIIQEGSTYETHIEQVYTKNDYITLRDGAVSGLSNGSYSGLKFEKYDGTNTGSLVIDNEGTARVGNEGDEQPLLTRAETSNLSDNGLLVWDGANKRAINSSLITADNEGNLTAKSFAGELLTIFDNIQNNEDTVNLINQSKAMYTGQVSNNPLVYADVKKAYHSSFDKSKFTIAGSLSITNDGIASGFSSSNLIYKDVDLDNKSFVIETPVYHYSQTSSADQYMTTVGTYNNKLLVQARILVSGKISIGIRNDSTDIVADSSISAVLGNKYQIKFVLNTSVTEVYLKTNDDDYVLIKSVANTNLYTLNSNRLYIGNAYVGASQPFLGSIDLKYFSITVDGKEVFNGNKTGLDVIKPDNYTVVGSPTISNDGIYTPAANAYINTDIFDYSKPFKFNFQITPTLPQQGSNGIIAFNGQLDLYNTLRVAGTNSINFYFYKNTEATEILRGSVTDLPANISYNCTFEWTGTQYVFSYKSILDEEYILGFSYDDDTPIVTASGYEKQACVLGNRNSISTWYVKGSMDLNQFKFYSNGSLIYQACLKIPYTLSKTDSKIVDEIYRDRVIDLYEQEGQAGYYTIDEENKNFTLPMGEIYGMIGQRRLISSTVTETHRVDIYSDKTCLVCGNVATAGTVNLPIELANNNYFVTLSASAKTATSFTTTATGDYILIGKVI